MPWWLWVLSIIGGLWLGWKAICKFGEGGDTGKTTPTQKAKNSPAPKLQKNPNISAKEWEAHMDKLGQIIDEIDTDTYTKCYNRIEKLITNVPELSGIYAADALAQCFEGICEERTPAAILNRYNKLATDRPGIALMHEYEDTEETISGALLYAIEDNYPENWTKAQVKKAIDLLEQDHPLVKSMWKYHEEGILSHLNSIGREAFEDEWFDKSDTQYALNELKLLLR